MDFDKELQKRLQKRQSDEQQYATITTFSHTDYDPNAIHKQQYSLCMLELELCGYTLRQTKTVPNTPSLFAQQLRSAVSDQQALLKTTTTTTTWRDTITWMALLLVVLYVTSHHTRQSPSSPATNTPPQPPCWLYGYWC